jgi:hypothetical protein
VFVCRPRISASARERYRMTSVKGDRSDASGLADTLWHEHDQRRPLVAGRDIDHAGTGVPVSMPVTVRGVRPGLRRLAVAGAADRVGATARPRFDERGQPWPAADQSSPVTSAHSFNRTGNTWHSGHRARDLVEDHAMAVPAYDAARSRRINRCLAGRNSTLASFR